MITIDWIWHIKQLDTYYDGKWSEIIYQHNQKKRNKKKKIPLHKKGLLIPAKQDYDDECPGEIDITDILRKVFIVNNKDETKYKKMVDGERIFIVYQDIDIDDEVVNPHRDTEWDSHDIKTLKQYILKKN